jgi:hypothetical protein
MRGEAAAADIGMRKEITQATAPAEPGASLCPVYFLLFDPYHVTLERF